MGKVIYAIIDTGSVRSILTPLERSRGKDFKTRTRINTLVSSEFTNDGCRKQVTMSSIVTKSDLMACSIHYPRVHGKPRRDPVRYEAMYTDPSHTSDEKWGKAKKAKPKYAFTNSQPSSVKPEAGVALTRSKSRDMVAMPTPNQKVVAQEKLKRITPAPLKLELDSERQRREERVWYNSSYLKDWADKNEVPIPRKNTRPRGWCESLSRNLLPKMFATADNGTESTDLTQLLKTFLDDKAKKKLTLTPPKRPKSVQEKRTKSGFVL
jgi:hypothetical protein